MASVEKIDSSAEFDKFVSDNKGLVLVVHFWAPWSDPCEQLAAVMDELAKEADPAKVRLVQLNAEAAPEVSLKHAIVAVPTFLFIIDDEVLGRINGAYAAELTKRVRQYNLGVGQLIHEHTELDKAQTIAAGDSNDKVDNKTESEETLNGRLAALVRVAPCMIFMKGSPEAPKCGFSHQLVDLLRSLDADFESFDILEDDVVRQGLKKFSQWPTFPQVYVNGELIGGLDIVREMAEDGQLADLLPKKGAINARLTELLKRSPVMIFMKGNPHEPKCQFSRALVDLLAKSDIKYDSFDILGDDSVRQGLKKFSNWPTYPQIYVKGELLGGLDILKELAELGELKKAMTP